MSKQKYPHKIRLTGTDRILTAIDWCTANLNKDDWDLQPIHLFKADYWFMFKCPQEQLTMILRCA